MFCSNCGKGEQEKNTYCRQCGDFLTDMDSGRRRGRHPRTPEERIRLSVVLNLFSAIAGFGVGTFVLISHIGSVGTHFSVYLAMSFLFAIGAWQTASLFNNLKLFKRFKRQKREIDLEGGQPDKNSFASPETKDLLPEADIRNVVPASVTEHTTKHLKQKAKRRDS